MHGESTARIPLKRRDGSIRAFALVDAADFPHVSRFAWWIDGSGYVASSLGKPKAVRRSVSLQRYLMEPPPNLVVDHINHDVLDNRRSNLRICTRAENMQNRAHGQGRSKHRGVCWRKDVGKWSVQFKLNGEKVYLGLYEDEDEAGRVAADWCRENMPYSTEAAA